MDTFDDKIVLITGGSRGIGAAISRSLDRLGARLLIIYRSNEAEAVNLLKQLEGDHQIEAGDDPLIDECLKRPPYYQVEKPLCSRSKRLSVCETTAPLVPSNEPHNLLQTY